jgi:hypothetical protein
VLIVNVPHVKKSLLRRFRLFIGQTDEKHGHLRQGYTVASLRQLLGAYFHVAEQYTYSRFFSEFIDTMIVYGVSLAKGSQKKESKKGMIVTGQDLGANQTMFKLYSLIYPLVWLLARLDGLLFFRSGYMLIARAIVAGKSQPSTRLSRSTSTVKVYS